MHHAQLHTYNTGYEVLKSNMEQYYYRTHSATSQLPSYIFLLSGGLSGGIASLITNPLDLAKLRIQVQRRQPVFEFQYNNIIDGLKQIIHKEGYRGLMKGATARLYFTVPSSAISIGTFDTIKQWLIKARHHNQY